MKRLSSGYTHAPAAPSPSPAMRQRRNSWQKWTQIQGRFHRAQAQLLLLQRVVRCSCCRLALCGV
jgi:hypothetical protein